MVPAYPAVRASAAHDALDYLDKFEKGARARVLAKVPASAREVLLQTSRSAWVSVEHDHFTVDAIVELFGAARAIQYWRAATNNLIERPLLKNFVSGMINVFGGDPGRIVGLIPKGWPLVYRGVSEPTCSRAEQGQAVVRFEQIALELRLYPNYFHSWHGTCLGIADLARLKGPINWVVSTDRSTAVATFKWDARERPSIAW